MYYCPDAHFCDNTAQYKLLFNDIRTNRVFSLTWPAPMQIYWNKRERLHKKRVQCP